MLLGGGVDEGADTADGQSLPSEGVEQEAAVVLPLAALSELGPGQSSARHHLPDLAVPRHQRPFQEQPVSLSQDPLVLGLYSPQSYSMGPVVGDASCQFLNDLLSTHHGR